MAISKTTNPMDTALLNTQAITQEDLAPVEVPMDALDGILSEDDIVKIEDTVSNTSEVEHFGNLVSKIKETDDGDRFLDSLGQQVIEQFRQDKDTRSALEDTLTRGFETLMPNSNSANLGNLPFEGACEIIHPLIRENAVKYQAKLCKALLPPSGPFKMDIDDPTIPGVEERAAKYEKKLNRLAKKKMKYDRDQEKNFLYFVLAGTGFKKVYLDTKTGVPKSEFVRIDDFVVSDMAKDLQSAKSYTHIVRRSQEELKRDIANGVYEDILEDITPVNPEEDSLASATAEAMDEPEISTHTEMFVLLEQYCYLDLSEYDVKAEGIEYPLPYQVTVDQQSGKVLSIRRNWQESDAYQSKIVNFFEYVLVPSTGFYGLGLFHLLSDFQQTLTAIVRSLVDSASFANLQAGFKKKGLRWKGDGGPLKPGEFRDIELLDNSKLSDVLMLMPFKEPSPTLFELMKELTGQGQKFADNLDQAVNESANYGKVGTTMAILEESAGFFSSIFQRVYGYMQEELEFIASLASDKLGPEFDIDVNQDGTMAVSPASDPNYPTRSHRLQLAQAKLNLALQSPQIHDMPEAFRSFYRALGEPEETIVKILPQKEQAQPLDPLSDIMAASNGQPIKAFEGQDHDAHIAVKSMFVQDPMNQNPLMGQVLPLLQANIKEHMVLKYVEQMKGLMTQQQATTEQAQVAAAQQILTANQAIAEQQATGGSNNPEMVYAQAEMKKADTLAAKEEFDQKIKTVKTVLDAKKIDLDALKEENKMKVEAAKLGLQADESKRNSDTELLKLTKENLDNYLD